MTPELLKAKIESDIAKSLAQFHSGDTDERSLREHFPQARFRAPHPVFDLSCSLLSLCLASGATAIRLSPATDFVNVEMEINGAFQPAATLPKELHAPIAARWKDAIGLDVTQQKKPQAGNFPAKWQDQDFHMPLSFAPTEYGEEIVMRFVRK